MVCLYLFLQDALAFVMSWAYLIVLLTYVGTWLTPVSPSPSTAIWIGSRKVKLEPCALEARIISSVYVRLIRQEKNVGSRILESGLGSVMEMGNEAVCLGASVLMISLLLEPRRGAFRGGSSPTSEYSEPRRDTGGDGVDDELSRQLGLGQVTVAFSSRTKLRMGFGITLGKLCWSGRKLRWPVE